MKAKTVVQVFGAFIALGVLIFVLTYYGFGMKRFWMPKHENLRREVFENTKSYSHGKAQELARYYAEYTRGTNADKQTLAEIIKVQFADFELNKIKSAPLRNFLTQARGY